MNSLKEKSGKWSILRIMLVMAWIVFIYLLGLFTVVLSVEIKDPPINYQGLALLFTAMIAEVGIVLVLKVIQKKFET